MRPFKPRSSLSHDGTRAAAAARTEGAAPQEAPALGRRSLLGLGGLWGLGGMGSLVGLSGLLAGCATEVPRPLPTLPPRAWSSRSPAGRLLIVGGPEGRVDEPVILQRFMELSGGPQARLRFITGATNEPDNAERAYSAAMRSLGATQVQFLHLTEAADSSHPELLAELERADGVFITGGDQARLMGKLWATPAMKVLHDGFRMRGLCVAGTSAGAAALSRAMIAQGPAVVVPQKDAVSLDLGLNFLPQALVDQHFSQRRRLPRLLSALAMRPDLVGIGIDEDTALLLDGGRALEVIGRSSVTIVDGLDLQTNFREIEARERLEMVGVNLHVLPAGRRYRHPDAAVAGPEETGAEPPVALRAVVAKLLEPPPILVL